MGDGTVYLAPFGFPAVTSSGTVTGCAPTVTGCGTMIATTGVFTGTADIEACGEGTGSATMIGSGTVWPAGFFDLVSFVSSGTVTGSGRVRGCGYLTGTGTFTITGPYTTTETPVATPTVNIYISYCPPEASAAAGAYNPLLRMAGNFSGDGLRYAPYAGRPNAIGGASNFTSYNTTDNSTTLDNVMCRICPEDSGICCPPYTDCGSDGHCPWTALQACGYAKYGVNLVAVSNSSTEIGMSPLPDDMGYSRLKAPGLPGSGSSVTESSGDAATSDGAMTGDQLPQSSSSYDEIGVSNAQEVRRRLEGEKFHGHLHGRALRVGVAHMHHH